MYFIFCLILSNVFTVHSLNCDYLIATQTCDSDSRRMCPSECAVLDSYTKRCKVDRSNPALLEGMFPEYFKNISNAVDFEVDLISTDPYIAIIDNFATEDEINALLEYGQDRYKRSTGLKVSEDGRYVNTVMSIRTSHNAWCFYDCENNPHVSSLVQKIEKFVNISSTNFEFAQLLRYDSCDTEESDDCSYYKMHNDFIIHDAYKAQGVRLLTFFLYLNDVDAGGYTVFSNGMSVQPKKGRALLWANVKSDNFYMENMKANHEARPVLKGKKFGVNFWIHQYDFKTPFKKMCSQ